MRVGVEMSHNERFTSEGEMGCGLWSWGGNQKGQRVSDYGQSESFGLRSWPNRGGRLGNKTRKE